MSVPDYLWAVGEVIGFGPFGRLNFDVMGEAIGFGSWVKQLGLGCLAIPFPKRYYKSESDTERKICLISIRLQTSYILKKLLPSNKIFDEINLSSHTRKKK